MKRLFLILLAVVVLGSAGVWAADLLIAFPKDAKPKYVGRATCAECHAAQLNRWTGSPHDKALDLATPETVVGNFDDQQFTHQGLTSRMFRRDGKYFVRTDGPDGKLADFQVKYVIGYDPLQQYMVEFPDGRVQVLRLSWDVKGKRWFYQFPPDVKDERLKADDPLHWTGPAMNWNHMCAECHSTDVHKNFDVAKNQYHTTFAEIDVSCETCHGPGSIHAAIAKRKWPLWDHNQGYGLAKLKGADTKNQIETCAQCHSRRRTVHGDFRPGADLLDYFGPAVLDPSLYHADGQILDEDYEYGSFVQSKMHSKGIRCSDCHDPHSTKLLHKGNALCTSCHQHPAAKYDVPAHHHHAIGSTGAECVNCHMPTTHYMVVDPRRDHSIRIPRPDLSVKLGTPNACTGCHLELEKSKGVAADLSPAILPGATRRTEVEAGEANQQSEIIKQKSSVTLPRPLPEREGGSANQQSAIINHKSSTQPAFPLYYPDYLAAARAGDKKAAAEISRLNHWAKVHTEQWYGVRADRLPPFAAAMDAARRDAPDAEALLVALARNGEYPAIVRATAIGQLIRFNGPLATEAIIRGLTDPDPLVRATAVGGIATRRTDGAGRVGQLASKLTDPVRLVRVEAARILATDRSLLSPMQQQQLDAALAEYRAGQAVNNDQATAHGNLGTLSESLGQFDDAEREYLIALKLDKRFFPAQFNLALLYSRQGKKDQTEKLLRGIIREAAATTDPQHLLTPVLVDANYLLGLLLNERPEKLAEAEQALLAAWRLDPQRVDVTYGLATFYADHGRWDDAEKFADRVNQLTPRDSGAVELLQQIRAGKARSERK